MSQHRDANWWFGPNSLWAKVKPDELGFAGFSAKWDDKTGKVTFGKDPAKKEADMLLYGGIALLVYIIATKM